MEEIEIDFVVALFRKQATYIFSTLADIYVCIFCLVKRKNMLLFEEFFSIDKYVLFRIDVLILFFLPLFE